MIALAVFLAAGLVHAAEPRVVATFTPIPVDPGSAPAGVKLPSLLKAVDAKYSKAATLTAKFTQVNESAALKQKKTSSGVITAKRPDKVRWETLSPDPNTLVSDGKTFWYYTPPFDEGERGQLIVKKAAEIQSRLATALLSGSFSSVKGMRFRKVSPSKFVILPRTGSAGTVERIEIEVDPERKLIQRVLLDHKGGNRAEITLKEITLGVETPDEKFRFSPPPNTDRVE